MGKKNEKCDHTMCKQQLLFYNIILQNGPTLGKRKTLRETSEQRTPSKTKSYNKSP